MKVIYCDRVYFYPDTLVSESNDNIVWYHRNEPENCLFYKSVIQQQVNLFRSLSDDKGLSSLLNKYPDPAVNVTWGGILTGSGFVKMNDTSLVSSNPSNSFALYVLIAKNETNSVGEWMEQASDLLQQFYSQPLDFWRQLTVEIM